MSFSERMGLVPQKQIQVSDVDKALRHRIINVISLIFSDNQAKYILDIMGYKVIEEETTFRPFNEKPKKNIELLKLLIEKTEWNRVYDVIEHGFQYLEKKECDECDDDCYDIEDGEPCAYLEVKQRYIDSFNSVLEQEKSGFRIINGIVSPVIENVEILSIEEATDTEYLSVSMHLKKALQLYSDRQAPDYENSIKESISAVESMCCIILGENRGKITLGNALKEMSSQGIHIHPSLGKGFSLLYGYTSDEKGIRHGGINFTNAPSEDAKYMLVTCSAFVNYLKEKHCKMISEQLGE